MVITDCNLINLVFIPPWSISTSTVLKCTQNIYQLGIYCNKAKSIFNYIYLQVQVQDKHNNI